LKDCEACKAKQHGRSVHRVHHALCVNNRWTGGLSASALEAHREEAKLKKHFAAPLTETEKCRGEFVTPEAAAAFFTPREPAGKRDVSATISQTQTVTTTPKVTFTSEIASDGVVPPIEFCKAVTEEVTDTSFLEENKNNKAPIAMLAFARVVVERIVRNKRSDMSQFNGLAIAVPATNDFMHPQHS